MKRLFVILLAAMMVLSFTACDKGDAPDPDKDDPGISQSGENNGDESNIDESTQNNDVSTDGGGDIAETTLADILRIYGLSEDDFKPEGFKEHSTYSLMGKPGETQSMLSFFVAVDGQPTEEHAKTWYGNLFDKLTELSDTDKVYGDMQGALEMSTAEDVINASTSLTDIPSFNCYYPCPIGKNRTYLQFKVTYQSSDHTYGIWIWVMNYLR